MKKIRNRKLVSVLFFILISIGLLRAQTTTTTSSLDTVKKLPVDTALKKPAAPQIQQVLMK